MARGDQINQGNGEPGIRGSLPEDHHLWPRFMAATGEDLATGRLKLVGYIPSPGMRWMQTCSALAGVVA